MGKLEKLYRRALTSPGSVRFSDLERLLLSDGFTQRQPSGGSSHYIFEREGISLTIPKHGGNAVKPVYVRRAIAALELLGPVEDIDGSDVEADDAG